MDKARRNKQNAASRKRFEDKAYRKVTIRLPKDMDPEDPDRCTIYMQIEEAARQEGVSVNAWINDAIRDKL